MNLQELYLQIIRDHELERISYQEEFLTDDNLFNSDKPVVLAFGTGGGKTYTTIMRLEMFYRMKGNSNKRTLIIPADTRVLRDNFYQSLQEFDPSFTYTVACDGEELVEAINSDVQCIISLPQTLCRSNELIHFHNVVLDEAHKWYFSRSIRNIFNIISPKNQLLLTGTPFKYNALKDQYNFYYLPVGDMLELGKAHNTKVSVISTVSNVDISSYDLQNHDINKSLIVNNNINDINNVFKQVDINKKTIVYCYSIQQAEEFHSAFANSLLSTSKNDRESVLFDIFKEDNTPILFVVGRGREGFDMPELMNVVDFTFSTFPEGTLQIIGRTLRISKLSPDIQKRYIKVAPQGLEEFYQLYVSGVLSLTERENYSSFQGRFNSLPLKVYTPNNPTSTNREFNVDNVNMDVLAQFEEAGIDMSINMWNELSNSTLIYHKEITMRNVASIFFGNREYNSLDQTQFNSHTEDSIREIFGKYVSIGDAYEAEGNSFKYWFQQHAPKSYKDIATEETTRNRCTLYFEEGKLALDNDPSLYTYLLTGFYGLSLCDRDYGTDFMARLIAYKLELKHKIYLEEAKLEIKNNPRMLLKNISGMSVLSKEHKNVLIEYKRRLKTELIFEEAKLFLDNNPNYSHYSNIPGYMAMYHFDKGYGTDFVGRLKEYNQLINNI